MEKIINSLFNLQDLEYREFVSKLTPSIPKECFIGVRVPLIRNLVKQLSEDEKNVFLSELPHTYYEENLLHGFIIQKIKNYDECLISLNKFLPFVDNWAVSDTMGPAVFKKNKDKLYNEILKWINSGKTYSIRFGVDMLMTHYLDESFDVNHLYLVSKIKSNEYYVMMMVAWYYATSLAKKWDYAIKIFEDGILDKWVHNKSIQKAIESNRIDNNKKEYLRTLKK